nr:hypothetical protein Iba_scaffold48073CG0010 [Ipomoea batatas]
MSCQKFSKYRFEVLLQILKIWLLQDCEYLGRYIFSQHTVIDPIINKGIPGHIPCAVNINLPKKSSGEE